MATNRQTDIHTHACAQCSHASVGLAQAHPNHASVVVLPLRFLALSPGPIQLSVTLFAHGRAIPKYFSKL